MAAVKVTYVRNIDLEGTLYFCAKGGYTRAHAWVEAAIT